MTTTPNPTWYDVLGVSRDASPEEIKAAWRHATDKFEPGSGSGQFRMFNEAADVLLDPTRRAAYDQSLEASGAAGVTAEPPPPPPVAVDVPGPEDSARTAPVGRTAEWRRRREERRAERAAAPAPAPEAEPASGRLVLATAVLAVLTVIALVLVAWLGLKVRDDAAVADARTEAPAAAEQAAKAIFAYDYQHLEADKQRAKGYLTARYGKDYLKAFDRLEKQADGTPGLAVQTKTVVKSSVLGSGIVDAEKGVARVLVYVNLVSTRPNRDPQIFQNRVAMKMVKDGNRWLVDRVDTY